jgi:hypothetical protein
MEASLNTVHDLFVEALALKQQGLSPRQIADRLITMGHGMGFAVISDRGSGGGGQPTIIELTFRKRGGNLFRRL